MPSLCVTGSAGFVYSHVARYFVQQDWDVTIADHFDWQGKARNIRDLIPHVKLLIGDLATGTLAPRCAEVRPDYVIHAASFTHVDDSITDPERFMLNNTIGTTRLLQALWHEYQETGHLPRKIIIISTDEVYGSTPPGIFFDEQAPYNPSNAYAASKVGVEAITRAFYLTHQVPLVVVRPCNTYSTGQFPSKVIPKFVRQMLRGEPVTLYNDGQGSRDWLHALDHARAIHTLLDKGLPGETYNLGAGEEHTDEDICRRIQGILTHAGYTIARQAKITLTPGRPGHDRRYAMNSEKLRRLGWAPETVFENGLIHTVLWNAKNQDYWTSDAVTLDTEPEVCHP
jgi:dTDP-glucose 4,6-dehydratase